jgi:hypothetical protein
MFASSNTLAIFLSLIDYPLSLLHKPSLRDFRQQNLKHGRFLQEVRPIIHHHVRLPQLTNN